MPKAEQVPKDVAATLGEALLMGGSNADAIVAAINAWPGMWHIDAVDFEGKIILPLVKETPTRTS